MCEKGNQFLLRKEIIVGLGIGWDRDDKSSVTYVGKMSRENILNETIQVGDEGILIYI